MIRSYPPLLFFIICTCYTWSLFGQQDSLRPGWYTLGFNAGLSYQQSDVQTRINGQTYGLGVTLAKNLLHMPNGGIDFDMRGRLMYSSSVGLSPERNFNIANNAAVNGTQRWDYRMFPPDLDVNEPFIFNNHLTQKAELGLEGVLTLSKLRQRTGLVVSLFGGIGLDWFLVRTDQGNESLGVDYAAGYASVNMDATRMQRRRVLRETILDGTYESLADGFENNQFGRFRFMPGWGVELGYDVTTWWGFGLGHKITYTGIDDFDGFVVDGGRQDIHHYSYIQVWKRFNAKERIEEPPVINIINPPYTPYSTRDPYQTITAEIENIRRSRQITVTFNEQPIRFNYRRGVLTLDVLLGDGINDIVIHAVNSAGEAEAKQIIVLEDPKNDDPPFISFITPPAPNIKVEEPTYHIQAEITNMETPRNVSASFNGRNFRQFNYDMDSKLFSANVTLREGDNSFEIRASNRRGEDVKTTTINYEKPILPPVLTFVSPSSSPAVTTLPMMELVMDLREIDTNRGDQISLIYNGYRFTNYNYNSSTGRLTANLPLTVNENFLSVEIANELGADSGKLVVIRQPDVPILPPPTIRVNQANIAEKRSGNCQAEFDFTITHVVNKQNIQIRIGNKNINSFNFSKNSGRVWFDTRILGGESTLTISASNASGRATEQVVLNCEMGTEVRKPEVNILTPATDEELAQSRLATLTQVINIDRQDQIKVWLNDNEVRSFNFDSALGEVSTNITLREGENTFRVEARNATGMAADQRVLIFNVPSPPTVDIVKPADGSLWAEPELDFEARTTGIESRSQIELKLNGRQVTDFNFANNRVSAALSLDYRDNDINIRVQNPHGQDEVAIKTTYRIPLPRIAFEIPSKDTVVQDASFTMKALIRHIQSSQDVSLRLNGRLSDSFVLNETTGELTSELKLSEGENLVQVTAGNREGQVTEELRLMYVTQQVPPPQVRIISASQPVFDPFNPEDGYSNLVAEVTGASSARNIQVTHNDSVVPGFDYDEDTGRLTHRIKLEKGDNTITVIATNANSDTATDSRTIRY